MVDLSLQACHEFWEQYQESSVEPTIKTMELVEGWTFDGEDAIEKRIQKMGELLENYDNVSLDQAESLITACAYLKISRMLRILQAIDAALPGGAAKMLSHAERTEEENPHIRLFLKRNVTFERLRLLSTLLQADRMAIITRALEQVS